MGTEEADDDGRSVSDRTEVDEVCCDIGGFGIFVSGASSKFSCHDQCQGKDAWVLFNGEKTHTFSIGAIPAGWLDSFFSHCQDSSSRVRFFDSSMFGFKLVGQSG